MHKPIDAMLLLNFWNEKAMPLATLQQKKTQCEEAMTTKRQRRRQRNGFNDVVFTHKFFLRKFIAIEYKVRYAPINAINQEHKLYCIAWRDTYRVAKSTI